MHRRLRHLNPAHAGADASYDVRYLTGFANADPVTTWPDRTANARDATGSGTARPTYRTNVQAGQPCLRTGSNTKMLIASFPSYTNQCTMLGVLKDNGSVRMIFFGGGTTPSASTFFGGSGSVFLFRADGDGGVTTGTVTVTSPATYVGIRSGTGAGQMQVWQNGTSIGTGGSPTVIVPKNIFMRDYGGAPQYSAGDLYSGSIFPTNLSQPLVRRLAIAAGMSFKIGYN